MALTITDILQLQSLQKFELVSGKKGLNHYVTSAEIADYEFCSDILYPLENPFEKETSTGRKSNRAIQCLLPDCRGRSRRYDQAKAITEKKTMTGKEKKPSTMNAWKSM